MGSDGQTTSTTESSEYDASNILQDDITLRQRRRAVQVENLAVEPSRSNAPTSLRCDPVAILPFALYLSFMVATTFFFMHVQGYMFVLRLSQPDFGLCNLKSPCILRFKSVHLCTGLPPT